MREEHSPSDEEVQAEEGELTHYMARISHVSIQITSNGKPISYLTAMNTFDICYGLAVEPIDDLTVLTL